MNAYLLNRTIGSVAPSAFQVAQTTSLVHDLEPAPGIRFSHHRSDQGGDQTPEDDPDQILAHRSGANVLAIDHYEGRL